MDFTTSLRGALRAICFAGFAGIAAFAPIASQADNWPEKPVRVIVAGPAGGSADIVARLLGDNLSKVLGQPAVVDPRPGAAGAIAVNELSRAPHDGHTVLVAVNSLVSEVPHIVKLPVDMSREIKPVAEIARTGLVLVGAPSVPAKDLKELVSYVKTQPGKVSYASYSAGTMSHLLGLQFNKAAGIDLVHVGYKGSTPALADVMGGHVPLMFDGIPTSLPLITGGKIRPFAVSSPKRSPLLPDVPTFAELGYPQLEAVSWLAVWVKPDVPATVQNRLREAIEKSLAQPGMRTRLSEIGFELPGVNRSPEELTRALASDSAKTEALLREIGFKPE
ncbi:Tripartite-type tricarboxylate transporter, receptor component TctC [Variovorax sp. HW608]|nr:Tripartite-type tricarboxylate transporter, receptor component TctC [Variovorax sp. HW608]